MNQTYCLRLLTILILILLGLGYAHTKMISGTVFEDVNGNLILDDDEKGIQGVLISNQFDVVKTDEKGKYIIPVQERSIIYIIKPRGYNVPVDKNYSPKFYYIHDPNGSPDFRYQGVKPTGRLPDKVDFPLYQSEPRDTFKIIVFADPQTRNDKELDYMRDDIITELVNTDASGGIVLGDIMFDDLSFFDKYKQLIGQIGIPFYQVPGNHDMNYDAPDDQYALETFKHHFGPTYYAFQYGKVHFIVLDDVEYQGLQEQIKYIGKIGTQKLKWIENYLQHVPEDHLIVLNMHIPLYTFVDENPSINVTDRKALFSLLSTRQHLLVLAGHMHMIEHQFLTAEVDWHGQQPLHQITCGTVSGTWWSGPPDIRGIPIADQRDGVPNGYHIFEFSGNRFTERYKSAQMDDDYQIRISWPVGKIQRSELDSLKIVVNIFNGSEKSEVTCLLDNQKPITLTREIMIEPHFEAIYSQFRELYASWVNPQLSNHLWTGSLPFELPGGLHKITIYTTNKYGDKYKTTTIFELE